MLTVGRVNKYSQSYEFRKIICPVNTHRQNKQYYGKICKRSGYLQSTIITIYISFIRPLLEYTNVVWDNCTHFESNELEKIQNEAARIVTGATKLVSLHSLYTETGWESLASSKEKT